MGDQSNIERRIDDTLEILESKPEYKLGITKSDINSSHELSMIEEDPEVYNAELREVLNNHLATYNDRFNTNITFDDLNGFLTFATVASREDKKVKEIIMKDLMHSALDYISNKTIFVLVKTVDTLMNNIQQKIYNNGVTEELLAVLDRLVLYYEKFQKMKSKYSINNLEDTVKTIRNESSSTNPEDIRIVNDLINEIRRDKLNS